MITATDLTCTFRNLSGRHPVTPLRGVSHTFPDSHVTYVLGLNGTGKSTLLRLLCGVRRPTSGRVLVDGPAPGAPDSPDAPGRVTGMFLDTTAVHPGHTGRRHLRWLAAASGLDAAEADRRLTQVGLDAVATDTVSGYSLGMLQRLGIAGALLGGPRNVVLDEPLNGLDIAGVLWLRRLLRDLADSGRCVIVASHHLAEVEKTADSVLLLEAGRVAASGTVAEVRGEHASLEDAVVTLVPRSAGSAEVRR
ncbi:ABC transporter ATP-binding protein [Corynebacterium provencense]|uniref:ABC transporter ATP-binding protein n=1 Tax=Corynebacterium provencense TaxID=1737425 RepID=UPI00083515A9|nr:ATP-binding cassette domain-containing protein [Corynebacterium provencense]